MAFRLCKAKLQYKEMKGKRQTQPKTQLTENLSD